MSLLSIIVPVLNEEENIFPFYDRMISVISALEHTVEFIFVDDGSTDQTLSLLKKLASMDGRIRIIVFSRNFGSHAACLAGLEYAQGAACLFLSVDLQDPPEVVRFCADKWGEGYDVVIGVRDWGKQGQGVFPKLYYRMVRRFALGNMPESGTDMFLISRKVVNAVVAMKEKNTSIFGLILWSGFRQAVVTYEKKDRTRGLSKWTLAKKIKLFVDTFVSFSYFPLRMMSVVGMLFALAGFLYSLVIIIARLFFATAIEGWASLMVVLLVVSGVQMVMLGILGEYLWRNFDESRHRPPFIVSDMIGAQENREMKGE